MNKSDSKELKQYNYPLDELEAMESYLLDDLNEDIEGLDELRTDFEKIGSTEAMGESIQKAVWEQFMLQLGVEQGKDFISENNGQTLDLRNSAHIQTTENFKKGKIATHNTEIDYQQRYDDWQSNFLKNEDGTIKTHKTRGGKDVPTLVSGARNRFDEKRATGNVERGTDIDHTVSAGEIIRDPSTNAHLSKEEQIAFANSFQNLNEISSSWNRSKGDTPTREWLDNPNKNGQKPTERFAITEKEKKELLEKDEEARKEWDNRNKKGEERSIKTGRKSQVNEAIRIGKAGLRAVLLSMLADFLKTIIRKLVNWLAKGKRSLKTFLEQFKNAWNEFWRDFKNKLKNAGITLISTIASAIFGPIVSIFTKAWTLLKEGWKSLKGAMVYFSDPANKDKPLGIKILQVSKIIIGGLSGVGAILLGELIEKNLLAIGLVIQIPLLGSLASILGMFLGAVVSGVLGTVILKKIDEKIAQKLQTENVKQQIDKGNEIIHKQNVLINITRERVEQTENKVASSIIQRHQEAHKIMNHLHSRITDNGVEMERNKNAIKNNNATIKEISNVIKNNRATDVSLKSENEQKINEIFNDLNNL